MLITGCSESVKLNTVPKSYTDQNAAGLSAQPGNLEVKKADDAHIRYGKESIHLVHLQLAKMNTLYQVKC